MKLTLLLFCATMLVASATVTMPAYAVKPRIGSTKTMQVNEAKKFCSVIDGITARISTCRTETQVDALLDRVEYMVGDVDESYVITSADRIALKRSLNGFFRTIIVKAGEFAAVDVSDSLDAFDELVGLVVDNSVTLEDLGNNLEEACNYIESYSGQDGQYSL